MRRVELPSRIDVECKHVPLRQPQFTLSAAADWGCFRPTARATRRFADGVDPVVSLASDDANLEIPCTEGNCQVLFA